MQESLKELEEKANQSLLPPHFVFNALGVIQSLMNTGKLEEANHYLSSFGQLIRANQQMYRKAEVTLQEELDYLDLYIRFEQKRFDKGFHYNVTVKPGIDPDDTYIPVNLLRPLLENSIWYGLLPVQSQGEIFLIFSVSGDHLLVVDLYDNGCCFYKPGSIPGNVELLKSQINSMREKTGLAVSFSCHCFSGTLFPEGNHAELYLPL